MDEYSLYGRYFIQYYPTPTDITIDNVILGIDLNSYMYACTLAIVLGNYTTGHIIFSGLSKNAAGTSDYKNDFVKRYVATACAIESARAYITDPVIANLSAKCEPNVIVNAHCIFGVKLIPGEYYKTPDGAEYRYPTSISF